MIGHKEDASKWIAIEIRDPSMSKDTVMAFPILLTEIFLDVNVPKLPDVDRYIKPQTTNDLFISYKANPMSTGGKKGATLTCQVYEAREHKTDMICFINMHNTHTATRLFEPLDADVAGNS